MCLGSLRSPPTRGLGPIGPRKMRDWDSKRDAAVEEAESQSREFLQEMIDQPEGPWSYLAERANQVRDLRDRYRDRQCAAQEESERLQQRLSAADDLVDAAQEIRKALADGEPMTSKQPRRGWIPCPEDRSANGYERWQGFAAIDAPVVTVYGSYDTGKSSLLRRVLIELGQAVPSWLTISARHETFEVNEIRAAGCVLRDTPGFVVEGADARAQVNTELASEAIVLTDVAIVMVTPQLVTAEYPVLRQLIQQDWVPGSLWFVISRFDEAGVDPDDDPDGYRRLAERKTLELRTALDLDDAVPVHVVCADFAQMAGAEHNPDPEVWDDSRDWDRIAGLVKAITDLCTSGASGLRQAAEQRFWRNAVKQALVRLPEELEKHLDNAVVSDEGGQRRASWLAQLDTLTRAAKPT